MTAMIECMNVIKKAIKYINGNGYTSTTIQSNEYLKTKLQGKLPDSIAAHIRTCQSVQEWTPLGGTHAHTYMRHDPMHTSMESSYLLYIYPVPW